jgi:O-antigen ligase
MLQSFRTRIPDINSWLLTALFFLIPTQIAPAYILTTVMLVLWLIEGRFAEKLRILRVEPLAWIFVAYYGVYLLSMLWTTDTTWGWRMVGKQTFFLLFPLYFIVARREHLARYVGAFLLGIAMCEVLAYYNWVHLNVWHHLPDGIRAQKSAEDTAPFVDRIMYAPALALAGYLAGHRAIFGRAGRSWRILYAFLFVTTVGNLIFSGGRAGLVGFLAVLALLVFQRFSKRPVLAAITALAIVCLVVAAGYEASSYFRERVDTAVDQVLHYEKRTNSSVGLRITYAANAWRIFMSSPIIGIGTGDYPVEYKKMNAQYSPQWEPAWNPHNQYLLALTSVGLLGGVALLLTLAYPALRRGPPDGWGGARVAVPVLFMTICLFESYLMRSNTSMMYVLFSAALWRGVQEPAA